MRLKLFVCGVTTLVPVLLLTGCGADLTSVVESNVQSPGVAGRAMGGQQPVVGATIAVYAMGSTGYGSSSGLPLSSALTDANGNFTLPGYTCPQADTPVYLLGIGGNAGAGPNASAVEAAALGPCASAQQSYVIMNEVTTAATAFVFSHFFSTTTGGSGAANDSIGGPSTTSGGMIAYSRGMVEANNTTIPVIVENPTGSAVQGGHSFAGANYTVEWQKLYTIANILSACINSSGSPNGTETKTACGKIFHYTQGSLATRPSDTLQAAVQMALHPTTQVTNLYNIGTGNAPFTPYLTTAPNDWTIGVSYTTTTMGLGVDTGTVSTLDIDSTGRVWFPSNLAGKEGASYFDPVSMSFNGPFNSTGLGHSQQVAIDKNGYAWFNDSTTSTVPGYLTTSTSVTESVSFPGTVSTSLTVGGDDRVNVGITHSNLYELANISADRTNYSLASGVRFTYPVTSIAGDTSDGDAVTGSDTTTQAMRYYYVTAAPLSTQIGTANDNSGQVIYTGNDDVAVRSYSGTGNADDGLCIYSLAKCYNFRGALQNQDEGIAIDGGGQLWVAESLDAGILQVPVNNPGQTGGSVYLNSTGASNIPVNELLHGAAQGGTAVAPFGIGVDYAGNVWVTNAGCNEDDCTPTGNFTLTEIVGAAYPTITPVSAQITGGSNLVGTEPTY